MTEEELNANIKYLMNVFGLDEDKARMAIEKGFRMEALNDGSAMKMLLDGAGFTGELDKLRSKTEDLKAHASEGL